jgi:hypothetical protein
MRRRRTLLRMRTLLRRRMVVGVDDLLALEDAF